MFFLKNFFIDGLIDEIDEIEIDDRWNDEAMDWLINGLMDWLIMFSL